MPLCVRPLIGGIKWLQWHTLMFEGDIRVDVRHVCPKDVKKMLLQRARTVYWKKWAAKHEELKEGIWLELALALLRRRKSGLKSIAALPEICFCKEAGCRNDPSTLVGRMQGSAKLATRRKALKSTGSTTAQDGTRSDGRFQMSAEYVNKWPKPQRASGSGKEVSSSTL